MRSRYVRVLAIAALAVLSLIAAGIGAGYHQDLTRARIHAQSGSHIVITPCGPIEYAEMGAGPVLLAVHGAGGGFDQMLGFAAPIASGGYRVIAMSRFGYLRTPVPAHPSIALQADAHACLLDALGVRSAAVIGVSAGAPSSLEFALRYRERCTALVLLVPGWYPSGLSATRRLRPFERFVVEQVLRSDFLFWAMSRFLPTLAEASILGTPPKVVAAASPSEQDRVATLLQNISPVSERQAGLALEAQLTTEPLSKPLEMIRAPTLIMSAEDDLYRTYANAEFIARRIMHARFIDYPTGGHLWVGHNDEVLAAIEAFVSSTNSAD